MEKLYWLILGVLCVWRITHLVHAEDGPWFLLYRLRRTLGAGFWRELLDCFYCLSLWLSLPVALLIGEGAVERLMLWPALSAGASLLERVAAGADAPPVAAYFDEDSFEEKEVDPDVLR